MSRIDTIGFDADDTLWHNENLFEEHHKKYCHLLAEFHDEETVEKTLFANEMRNLELYGYGIKSFTLSAIETAISLTEGNIASEELNRIIQFGKSMLSHPVELLEHVAETVEALSADYRLILITKGDLRDQERKIAQSGLAHCFDHTEVVSEKNVNAYDRVFKRLSIQTEHFIMAGNSVKSDILPVLDLGGHGVHIPYHLTWQHERVSQSPNDHQRFYQIDSIKELPDIISTINR